MSGCVPVGCCESCVVGMAQVIATWELAGMPAVAGPPIVPLTLRYSMNVWVIVEAEAVELVGVETIVELEPFAKVMVVVVGSLLAVLIVVVVTSPPITWTSQLTRPNGVVLLFTTVKVQTPLAREHDAFCPDTNPDNGRGPPAMGTLVPTVVELSPRSLGKTVIATTPIPRATNIAMTAATPISFLNSAIPFQAPR
jgi:hypothetical protein